VRYIERLIMRAPLLLLPAALFLCSTASLSAAEKLTAPELIHLAQQNPSGLKGAIADAFTAKDLQAGTAFSGRLSDFFFVIEAQKQPAIVIDEKGGAMTQVPGTSLWYSTATLQQGKLHQYYYTLDGTRFGGRTDVPAYTELSYVQPGVPQGKLSEKMIFTSKLYDGMTSEYWTYVPAGYDASKPAALMVFQDGGGYINREGGSRALNVIDNLIAQHKIPVMICVFVNPGDISGAPGTPTYKFVKAYSDKWKRTLKDSMRSTLYDTVSDRYPRFLRDELLPAVEAKYNIRKDAYSRAVTGSSSGGICAFNVAWQQPNQFSRVITWVGSFTSIQWKEDPSVADGGNDYTDKVRREDKRNIRVWMQDGSEDQENPRYGSWPLENIAMANSLKLRDYDFHFSFGKGTHNGSHGGAELPQEITWVWRGYDAARTEQLYEMEPEEKAKPLFRVTITNRSAE
jgi:enterochelin esterase-like enzyme